MLLYLLNQNFASKQLPLAGAKHKHFGLYYLEVFLFNLQLSFIMTCNMARIPGELVNAVLEEAESYDPTIEYAKNVMAQAKANPQHALLYEYLRETAQRQGEFWFSYAIALAISYDTMQRFTASQRLDVSFTEAEIASYRKTTDAIFNDPRWEDEQWVLEKATTYDGVGADSGVGYFLNLLGQVAPELASVVASYIPEVENPTNRRHVFRGFYDGFMPIYAHLLKSGESQR